LPRPRRLTCLRKPECPSICWSGSSPTVAQRGATGPSPVGEGAHRRPRHRSLPRRRGGRDGAPSADDARDRADRGRCSGRHSAGRIGLPLGPRQWSLGPMARRWHRSRRGSVAHPSHSRAAARNDWGRSRRRATGPSVGGSALARWG
jgi:hypothetical protein